MSDNTNETTEMWKQRRKFIQRKKESDLIEAESIKHMFRVCTPYHWQRKTSKGTLNYWPSTGKWQWDDKIYHGSHLDIVGFMHKRGL